MDVLTLLPCTHILSHSSLDRSMLTLRTFWRPSESFSKSSRMFRCVLVASFPYVFRTSLYRSAIRTDRSTTQSTYSTMRCVQPASSAECDGSLLASASKTAPTKLQHYSPAHPPKLSHVHHVTPSQGRITSRHHPTQAP